jgi:hypothetical protein
MNNEPQYANDHVATIEELSALALKGWEPHDLDETRAFLSAVQAVDSDCFRGERVAMGLITKTKEELAALIERWDEETADLIMDTLKDTREALQIRLDLVECAEARVLVAGSSLISSSEGSNG